MRGHLAKRNKTNLDQISFSNYKKYVLLGIFLETLLEPWEGLVQVDSLQLTLVLFQSRKEEEMSGRKVRWRKRWEKGKKKNQMFWDNVQVVLFWEKEIDKWYFIILVQLYIPTIINDYICNLITMISTKDFFFKKSSYQGILYFYSNNSTII